MERQQSAEKSENRIKIRFYMELLRGIHDFHGGAATKYGLTIHFWSDNFGPTKTPRYRCLDG